MSEARKTPRTPTAPAPAPGERKPQVTALHLRDPATGRAVCELAGEVTLQAKDLPPGATVTAEVAAGTGSVTFQLDGAKVRTETNAPLCLSGDSRGKLLPFAGFTPGTHELRVTPFSRAGGAGAAGAPRVVRLTVVPPPVDPPPEDVETGWTEFPLAPGARAVHVAADGDDANGGLSARQPVRTILRGYALLRD